jgi:hypothetical protein
VTTRAQGKIAEWKQHPEIFVREVFGVVPDRWQDKALQLFPSTPRLAMKDLQGPGQNPRSSAG